MLDEIAKVALLFHNNISLLNQMLSKNGKEPSIHESLSFSKVCWLYIEIVFVQVQDEWASSI